MKIKEVQELLSISRSNIRFYEKQGLLRPQRQENNYRDYTQEDITTLKQIIVYRKMGFTVEEISQIQKNELSFSEALSTVELRLEQDIEKLEGSLKLVKAISQKYHSFDQINSGQYWEIIRQQEENGSEFVDICLDYIQFEGYLFEKMWKINFFHDFQASRKKYGFIKAGVILLLISVLRGIGKVVIWKESFASGFFYPWILFIGVSLLVLPYFILMRKKPNVGEICRKILLGLSGFILSLLLLGLIIAAISAIFS